MGHHQTPLTTSSVPYPTQQRHSLHFPPSHLPPSDVSTYANVVDMAWTPTSSFYSQTLRFSEMSQNEQGGAWAHDPVTSHRNLSTNETLYKSTIDDIDSAYADPVIYIIDTNNIHKSVASDMDSAYSDPAIYAVNTTTTSDGDLNRALFPPAGRLSEKRHEGLWHPKPFHI
ncbi:hypothetical protein AAF712_015565 [Marasmius tenuissimus]|uniref:Uncharacterized protein n=1 Tax=Marasmius tenuissimus TaxID=585030 RepID=A0ABR2ZA60_9AGAR